MPQDPAAPADALDGQLVLDPAAFSLAPASAAVADTPDPLRVLLLEDDPDHAALVEAYLADVLDPEVELVHTGTVAAAAEVLAAARDAGTPFHAVLADQQLPDSSYWETVPRIVAAAGGAPVVALTSLGDLAVALDAVRAGATDYLVKAELTPEVLRRTLRYAVERAARDAALRQTREALVAAMRREAVLQTDAAEQEKAAAIGRLLAGVADTLRNPLGLAVGFAEAAAIDGAALRDALDAGQADAAAEHLAALLDSAALVVTHARRADDVVSAMYAHTRGLDGERHPVRLAAVVQAAQAQTPTDGVAVEVDVADSVEVAGSGEALVRMVANLLSNAVRAAAGNPAGGRVRVSARAVPDAVAAVLVVEDDGAGLSGVALAQAFVPFATGWPDDGRRADGSGSGRSLGLGLPFARAVAVRHGGQVELGPSSLGGTAAYVVLPSVA